MSGRGSMDGGLRAGCMGVLPLPARLEPWQEALCDDPARIAAWLDIHGSPVNLIDPAPMGRNADALRRAARAARVDMKVFFARKANKALALVDEAARIGLGVDVASEAELAQTLDRGVRPADIVVTAAVKPRGLLELCASSGATVAIDNRDELESLAAVTTSSPGPVPVALRLSPSFPAPRPESRFGVTPPEALAMIARWGGYPSLALAGVHFHLDGYDAGDRVAAIDQSLALIDAMRAHGHAPAFIDIGGGIPMSYLDDEAPWRMFWREHIAALRGERPPLTFDGHGLGLSAHRGEVLGRPNVYPSFQRPVREEWLGEILRAPSASSGAAGSIADAIRARGLQLRCEPGRSLLDGCGLTAARVEYRKQRADGTWLIGVAMNRTQCRSTSDDFLVDPLLLRPDAEIAAGRATGPIEGYLVGAYCIERELLTWRRLSFPRGVECGDVVVFPNTAGYLMHILESPSHQIPLARNLIVGRDGNATVDLIDY